MAIIHQMPEDTKAKMLKVIDDALVGAKVTIIKTRRGIVFAATKGEEIIHQTDEYILGKGQRLVTQIDALDFFKTDISSS